MKKSQKLAISYAISERARKRRIAFILEKEGTLVEFAKSRYKSMFWYIYAKYGERIY